MFGLTYYDISALVFFLFCWLGYHVFLEHWLFGKDSLNSIMNRFRFDWMNQMEVREVRMVDTQIMGSLQNGTAFFASTSLLAIGAAATLLRATDDVLQIFQDLPFGVSPSRGLWELKAIGLMLIFGYAFFKFSWSYRLFNYAAILMGATPSASATDLVARRQMATRAGEMIVVAGSHFNRGQRAFFFALAYLGWFIGPIVFVVTSLSVVLVMALRQFHSSALRAVKLTLTKLPDD